MLFGITRPDRGEIRVDGRTVRPRSPRDALQLGISLLPEDRHQQGLVLAVPDPGERDAADAAPAGRPARPRRSRGPRRRSPTDFAGRMRVVATGIEQLDQHALRRQPAEGAAGQVADSGAARADPRPADARHRRRRQGGDPPHRLASGHRGHRDHPDQRRCRGGDRDGRSHPGLSRRPGRGRVHARGSFDQEAMLLAAAHVVRDGEVAAPAGRP